ncbi:MAG: NAD-dependent epimerase/dehydratase family protein [Bacteroidetes bacterium]|jgi:GDP-L-fucose synthase|nr:NAD-dependent epimerase/dehydratase family protein [Bacteroidota bacterium]
MKNKKIYIAGHRGMVGSAIKHKLEQEGYKNLVFRTSAELNLTNQQSTDEFFASETPDIVIIAAARVGGILANDKYPYPFLYDNLQIQNNLINASHKQNAEKVIFLGSSCIYPKLADQPLKEEYLLTGPLEPTNQWYAVAKIAGIKLIEALRRQHNRNYVSLMPTNLYGPRDNFDLETSHVLPAMIRKFDDARENGHTPVPLWGSGKPMREFLYVEDLADAVLFAMENNLEQSLYNIGTGKDITIKELAETVQKITGHEGEITWDSSKPDGTPRKLMDVSRMKNEGWSYSTDLEEGIRNTYRWFLEHRESIKEVKM